MWHSGRLCVGAVCALLVGAFLATAQPDTLVVSSTWGMPPGWNPLLPTRAWGEGLMYPSLFVYTPLQERWMPYLAEGFRWVDAFTLEVKLRPQAKWWDGRPITAHDVKFTWDLGKRHKAPWSPAWDYLEEVRVVDDLTVQFVTSAAKLNYFALLETLPQMILPKHRWELLEQRHGAKLGTEFRDDVPQDIVGGGPYKLVSWTPEFWTYERVDDWWGKEIFGLPAPRRIIHRVFKDNPAANLAFEYLELDAMTHFTPAVWELWQIKKLPVRTYYPESPFYFGYNIVMLYMNFARPPLNNPAVRKAIAHAVPFTDIIEKAYFGYSVKAHPAMVIHTSPAVVWIDEALAKEYAYTFDLEKAKQILNEANIIDRDGDGVRELPDGTKLGPWTIEVPFGWTDWMLMCEMIADTLRKIGMDVTAKFPDFAVWDAKVIRGEFDLIIRWSATTGLSHPWNVFRLVMDPRLTGPVGEAFPAGNWHRYMNYAVIPFIDAIPKETDPAILSSYYRQLQLIALHDMVAVPLFYGAVWYIFSENNWLGWPKAEHPDRWFSPLYYTFLPHALPTLFGLVPKGQDPGQSAFVRNMLPLIFTTDKFWEGLAAVK